MVKSSFSIQRISGSTNSSPNTIGTTEVVAARVVSEGPGFDTHNCYDPSNKVYTIPVTGYYKVDTMLGSSQASQVMHKRAGDTIQINVDSFIKGEWLLSLDNSCIGIYDGQNAIIVVDSERSSDISKRMPVDLYRVVKIPENSTYKASMILYGKP